MPRWIKLLITLFILLLSSSCLKAEWFAGSIHFHTKPHSDGQGTMTKRAQQAKGVGSQYAIPADHFEQIPNFEAYFRDCQQNTNSSFLMIPGTEISTDWDLGGSPMKSHLLVCGFSASARQKLAELATRGNQQGIIDWCNARHLPTIAAHPNQYTAFWPWEQGFGYFFNFDQGKRFTLYEHFNYGDVNTFGQDLTRYLNEAVRAKGHLGASAGNDSHFSQDPNDKRRWSCQTHVYASKLTSAAILEALFFRRTYATQFGADFKSLNQKPGEFPTVKKVATAVFDFEIYFGGKIIAPTIISIYRDGKEIFRQNIARWTSSAKVHWPDDKASKGRHWYLIVAHNCLVTSPIWLEVGKTTGIGGLKVIATDPKNGEKDVELMRRPWVKFSEPIELASAKGKFIIEPNPESYATGEPLFVFDEPKDMSKLWWLMVKMRPNTRHKMTIKSGIRAISGKTLNQDFVIYFNTGSRIQEDKFSVAPGKPDQGPRDQIKQVVLGRDPAKQISGATGMPFIPKYPTTTFGPSDWVFLYILMGPYSSGKHRLSAVWYDPGGYKVIEITDDIDTNTHPNWTRGGSKITMFRVPGIFGEPKGKWTIKIRLDGKLLKTLSYQVR